MRALEPAAQALAAQGRRTLARLPPFAPLPPQAPPHIIAVDGSHAVLVDNGSVWVVAHRAAALAWPGPAFPPQPIVTAATPTQAAELLGEPAASAEAFAQALRERAEAAALLGAIRGAPAGTLVLADGALRGLPPDAQRDADAARAEAQRRGVTLIGVSKRSGLERDGVPLVAGLQAAGPSGIWVATVGDGIHVARLHAASPFAFRIDAASPADVGFLVPSSRDAAYVGYPYPLAKVHNLVAFTAGEVAELKAGLERELRRHGAGAMTAVRDFHGVLDRNVAG